MAVQFTNDLPRITSRLPKGTSQIVRKTAFAIMGKARIDCPKDTGHLANSIEPEFESPTKAIIGTPVEYAAHVHDGTSRVEGRPFLAQAADENRQEFRNELRNLERSLK